VVGVTSGAAQPLKASLVSIKGNHLCEIPSRSWLTCQSSELICVRSEPDAFCEVDDYVRNGMCIVFFFGAIRPLLSGVFVHNVAQYLEFGPRFFDEQTQWNASCVPARLRLGMRTDPGREKRASLFVWLVGRSVCLFVCWFVCFLSTLCLSSEGNYLGIAVIAAVNWLVNS